MQRAVDQLNEKTKQYDSLKADFDPMMTEVMELKKKLTAKEKELKDALAVGNNEATRLSRQVEEMEKRVNEEKAASMELRKKLGTIDEVQSRLDAAQAKVNSLTAELQSARLLSLSRLLTLPPPLPVLIVFFLLLLPLSRLVSSSTSTERQADRCAERGSHQEPAAWPRL